MEYLPLEHKSKEKDRSEDLYLTVRIEMTKLTLKMFITSLALN